MKKIIKKALIIGAIIIMALIVLYAFFIIQSFITNFPLGKILDDEPVYYFLCKIHPFTRIGGGCWECDNEKDYTFKWLSEWKGYQGCNESTKGYQVINGRGYICGLKSCDVIRIM